MRSIVSPLSGIRSPFGLRDGASAYAILGFDPALVFDFKRNYFRKGSAASNFGASITHARASSATMVNSSGTLVTVGNNVPRTGHHIYNGSAWINEGILHESEARTNQMVTYSNDFTNAAWLRLLEQLVGSANSRYKPVRCLSDADLVTPQFWRLGRSYFPFGSQRYQVGNSHYIRFNLRQGWSLVK